LQADLTFLSTQRYNSAFLYRPDGTQAETQYNKIHLVPFGEVVPFKKSCSFLYNLLMKFSPYDYDYSLDAGTEYTIFEMTAPDTNAPPYRFSVMICYEDAIPAIARRFAIEPPGRKRIDWLVNISNDGWFVRFKDDSKKVFPSTELPQHAAVCVFRAVENRLAILRSVNTGISCLIDSSGRIKDGYIAASSDFPYKAMDRKGVAGWFLDRVPIDKRTTFFSKYGQWLDFCCLACLFLTIILSLLERFGRRKIKGLTNEKNAYKS
ncbi:MAG: apolipoprotein N-acyltransferase, partial [Sedimentisphaerales bacterium]